MASFAPDAEPVVLIVPGLNDSGPDHWQTLWLDRIPRAARVELGMWDDPHRNTWVNQLNLAIHRARRPVILVAHSLGCHAVGWWNEYERPRSDGRVIGALLVAPPEVENPGVDERLARFAPVIRMPLPFPSILAASRNDHLIGFGRARRLARIWRSRFVDAGWLGHINAASGIGDWPFGQFLLRQLIAGVAELAPPLLPGRHVETLASTGARAAPPGARAASGS